MSSKIAVLAAGLAATVSAFDCSGPYFSFYNRPGDAMSYQRLDPALFPGTESPHLHSFDGGNALAASMDFATTQDSTCTSARIKPDNSLYWRPTLFWNGNNTGYYKVPEEYLKIYYKFGDAGNVRANVTEFPEGFRMIAGDPFKRSDDGNNPGGIKWSCKQENYQSIDSVGFPSGFTSCPDGFATEITFPSCWNGKDMDPKNPNAHMDYPSASGIGLDACPDGFKVARFPSIFIEFWYDISSFDGQYGADDTPWVLAQGDPTGFGWHADFLNGWEKGVLGKATAETDYCNCGCGCGNDQMKVCFGDDNVNDESDDAWMSCSAATETFAVDVASPLDTLPGCNPIQSGPAEATVVSGAGCSATTAPSTNSSDSSSSAVLSKTSSAKATLTATTSASSSAQAVAADVSSSFAKPDSGALPTEGYGEDSSAASTPTFAYVPASSFVVASSSAAAYAPSSSSTVESDSAATPTYPFIDVSSYVEYTIYPTGTGSAHPTNSTGSPYANHTRPAHSAPTHSAPSRSEVALSYTGPSTGVSVDPTLGLFFSDAATNPPTTQTKSTAPTGCGNVVYETVTNVQTVTVTAAAQSNGHHHGHGHSSAEKDSTTHVTLESTATVYVTVEPTQTGGYAYMPRSHRRHAHGRRI